MQVTIILSSPRSGSSWLSRVVRCIPDHCVFTHNTFTTQFLYTLYPLRSANAWGDDAIADRVMTDRLLDPWRVRCVRSHIAKRAGGKPIIFISPTLSNFLPLLSKAFPEARYVHFQRNPLDTIASMRKFLQQNDCGGFRDRYRAYTYGGRVYATRAGLIHLAHRFRWRSLVHPGYLGVRPGGFQGAASLSLPEFLSWYYSANQRDIVNGIEHVSPSRKTGAHYEHLIDDYDAALSALLDFMVGTDRDFEIPRSHDGVRTGAVGRRKQFFSDQELEIIRDYLRQHAPQQVLQPYGLGTTGTATDNVLIGAST